MKRNLLTAVLMTVATTILLGIIYPLLVTGIAQILFPEKANGQLIHIDGKTVGSRIIGQGFSGPGYFHSRPSSAGTGYDAANTNGSQLGPTNQKLIDRVKGDVAAAQSDHPGATVPIDLVTASASGIDPHITPAAAEYQLSRVAKERGATVERLRALVAEHTEGRQLGVLGEARVNVLELNLDLDQQLPMNKRVSIR
jgi:potassium-transporting ATPase KdpC subunit